MKIVVNKLKRPVYIVIKKAGALALGHTLGCYVVYITWAGIACGRSYRILLAASR